MEQLLIVERREKVALVVLNQPERRNPLSDEMAGKLADTLEELNRDPLVAAVVLTGAGKAFCAGGDLGQFADFHRLGSLDHLRKGQYSTRLFQQGSRMRKPLIAAVNGAAMGGGCGLVAMCHLAVAGENAKFATPEINVGLFPLVILPLMERAVGRKKALEMGLTGETLTAQEAKDAGLVNRVVADDRLLEETVRLAETLAQKSPAALEIGLKAYNDSDNLSLPEALDHLNTLRVITFMSEDLAEGARAFLEKRRPNWRGR